MQFPVSPPAKLLPQKSVRFDMPGFRKMLYLRGWRVTWEQAGKCPCTESADSDHPRPDCPVCDGDGWDYHSSQEIRALVLNATQAVEPYQVHGEYGRSHVFLTLLPEHLPSIQDRYTALDSIFLMKDYGERSALATDRMRYRISPRTMQLSTGTVVIGVTHCRKQDADGVAEEALLVEGTDFTVDGNGTIDWSLGDGLGTAPPLGRRYSCTYYAHPRFVAMEDQFSARDTLHWAKDPDPPQHLALPVKVLCRVELEGDDG